MKKTFFIALNMAFYLSSAQTLNTQTALSSKAERSLQFKISDAQNDVLEIGNSTSLNSQFQPTIWAHKESSTGPVMVFSANTVTSMDNGTVPMLNFVAGKDIFDNSAPNSSQFPWGNGGTTQPLVNRPIVAFSNAFNNLVLLKANGNFGIGTTDPSAKLHTVGNLRFENLPSSNSGCPLMVDNTGNVYRANACFVTADGPQLFTKKPILNALNSIKKIPTFSYTENVSSTSIKNSIDYDALAKANKEFKNNENENTQIIALLVESVKELSEKVESLEAELNKKNNSVATTNNSIKIYPNPVKDNLSIFFTSVIKDFIKISIYNAEGRKVSNYQVNPTNQKVSINVSNLPSGNYFYEITSDNNPDVSKGKFIKE